MPGSFINKCPQCGGPVELLRLGGRRGYYLCGRCGWNNRDAGGVTIEPGEEYPDGGRAARRQLVISLLIAALLCLAGVVIALLLKARG